MSDPTTVNVEQNVKPTSNVTVPSWLAGLLILAVGVLAGVEAEQGGFTKGWNFPKPIEDRDLEGRMLAIITQKVKAAQERWDRQEEALRGYCNETRCHCGRRGQGAAGEVGLPVGAAPAPAK